MCTEGVCEEEERMTKEEALNEHILTQHRGNSKINTGGQKQCSLKLVSIRFPKNELEWV